MKSSTHQSGCASADCWPPTPPCRFDVLRDTLQISDASCSKHLKTLADHSYVSLSKKPGADKGYKITWVALTEQGRRAFDDHVAALRRIVADEI